MVGSMWKRIAMRYGPQQLGCAFLILILIVSFGALGLLIHATVDLRSPQEVVLKDQLDSLQQDYEALKKKERRTTEMKRAAEDAWLEKYDSLEKSTRKKIRALEKAAKSHGKASGRKAYTAHIATSDSVKPAEPRPAIGDASLIGETEQKPKGSGEQKPNGDKPSIASRAAEAGADTAEMVSNSTELQARLDVVEANKADLEKQLSAVKAEKAKPLSYYESEIVRLQRERDKMWYRVRQLEAQVGLHSVTKYRMTGPLAWDVLPTTVQDLFSRNGRSSLIDGHFKQGDRWGPAGDMPHGVHIEANEEGRPVWSAALFKTLRLKASLKSSMTYADRPNIALDLVAALQKFPVKGKKVLVVCSVLPWVEALLLEEGAAQVFTTPFESKKPVWTAGSGGADHSPVSIVTHDDLFRLVIDAQGGHDSVLMHEHEEVRFDAVFCLSCVQHAGLGAYGEPIDPDGDLVMMREMRQWTRPGAKLFLALPTGDTDSLFFNSHRIYAKQRFSEITTMAGWDYSHVMRRKFDDCFHGMEWDNQPVFVLSRTADNQ